MMENEEEEWERGMPDVRNKKPLSLREEKEPDCDLVLMRF